MEFFGIGLFELAMIMLVTLIVVGPERLPETARQIGKVVRTLRRYAAGVQRELREGLGELTSEVEATRGEFRDLGRELRSSADDVGSELKETSNVAQGEFVDAEANRSVVSGSGRRGGVRRTPPRRSPRPPRVDIEPGEE